jgi:hypothetical protein
MHWCELTERLAERDHRLALVEVHRETLAHLLTWLWQNGDEYRNVRIVALLDRAVWTSASSDPACELRDRERVIDALREAGAVDVVISPRNLQAILALGQQLASERAKQSDVLATRLSIEEWAWASLPWQGE